MIGEVCRVLRPKGRFVMTNIDPYQMLEWALYRYFPAALREDLKDFSPEEQITSLLQEAGLAWVAGGATLFRVCGGPARPAARCPAKGIIAASGHLSA